MDETPVLSLERFAGREGEAFAIDGADVTLTLAAAQPLADSGRTGGSFRLEFAGPEQPILPQAIYRFVCDGEGMEIFIVPLASGPQGTTYEAVFF